MKCMHEENPMSIKTIALLAVKIVALTLLLFVFFSGAFLLVRPITLFAC